MPTWNYVTVHLIGVLELRPQGEMREFLGRQATILKSNCVRKNLGALKKMKSDFLDKKIK
jgi:transcriptional regulator